MQNATCCPICASPPALAFASKYVLTRKCSNVQCGHHWAFDVAHDHGVMSHDPERAFAVYHARNKRLVAYLCRRGWLRPDSSLLDVGSGSGHVVRTIAALLPNITVSCLEPNQDAAAFLRSKNFTTLKSLDDVRGTFDFISMIEVIEHVPDPVSVLATLRQRLSPRGLLFCTTPCGELRNGSRTTNAYDTPEHVGFFTERSLALAFARAGFTTCEFTRIAQLYPYPSALHCLVQETIGRLKDRLYGYSHLVCLARSVPKPASPTSSDRELPWS
jgi:SAM-dependent methyltransferase